MRRAVLAVIGTAAGTALLVGTKLGSPARTGPVAAAVEPSGSAPPPTPGRAAPPPPSSPAAGGLRNGTFTGTGADAGRYEIVTVTVTVSGGRISRASGSCGDAAGESRSICGGAMPILQRETLARQRATVATVSGASYTSEAYRTSLQSALDRAAA